MKDVGYVLLLFFLIFLPMISLHIYSERHKWPVRKEGPYLIVYLSIIVVGLLWAAGARGWWLLGITVVAIGGGSLVFYGYAYYFDVLAPRLREKPRNQ